MPSEFRQFLEDLLAPLGGVQFRRMFSGSGVYRDGVIFALVVGDVLYFKTDEAGRVAFEREGCGPFRFDSRGRTVTTSYWRAPERLYDEPDDFREWALAAVRASAANAGAGRSTAKLRGKRRAATNRRSTVSSS